MLLLRLWWSECDYKLTLTKHYQTTTHAHDNPTLNPRYLTTRKSSYPATRIVNRWRELRDILFLTAQLGPSAVFRDKFRYEKYPK